MSGQSLFSMPVDITNLAKQIFSSSSSSSSNSDNTKSSLTDPPNNQTSDQTTEQTPPRNPNGAHTGKAYVLLR